MTRYLEVEAMLPQLRRIGFVVRDPGLLASALARPEASVFGQDAYPTLWLKSAAVFESVIKNHPMLDGNKRTAWIALNVFLAINRHRLRASTDDAFDFILEVATEHLGLAQAAEWIDRHSVPIVWS